MIDPMACVGDDVTLPDNCTVWQFASVIRGARLGEFCTVGSCAIVDAARIGRACSIGHGAQLHPGLHAGDEVFFGPGCIVCNDPWPRVRKGDFDMAQIMAGLVVVRIADRASIGAGAIVLPGRTIGENAMIAAGAVVDCDVPCDHLFKRDGTVVPIGRRPISRMRAAA